MSAFNNRLHTYMNERMNEWTNEWMNEWMNERMNERTNEWMNERLTHPTTPREGPTIFNIASLPFVTVPLKYLITSANIYLLNRFTTGTAM